MGNNVRPAAIAALTVALATGAACGGSEPPQEPTLLGAVEVAVEPVRLSLLRHVITANGRITPHPDADWTIHAAETAIVAELPFAEGEPVATDAIVVKFEVPSRASALQAAEYDLTLGTSRLDAAKIRLAELTTLFQSGLTARIEVDAAKSELATAETNLTAVTATIAGLRAAEARDVVRARFPGVVLTRWHYQGDLVMSSGNDPVLRIVDPARMRVELDVPVTEAGRVIIGQRVTVMPVGLAPIVSTVAAILPSSSADASMTRVIVDLPPSPPTPPASPAPPTSPTLPASPAPPALSIGNVVLGEILIAEVSEAMTVPTQAILRTSGSPYVLVAGPDGRVARRDLRLGVATQEVTQVLEGLQLGEFVITSALTEITEGDLVRHRQ